MKAVLEREKTALASDASRMDGMLQEDEEEEMLELANLDLDDPNWMKHVSAKTLAKFNDIIAGGALDSVFHQWVPWWLRPNLSPVIQVLPSETSDGADENEIEEDDPVSSGPAASPPIIPVIPKLEDLTKIKPSPLIAFNVIEVIFAYVYSKNLFNGDWDEENADEALDTVITLSAVLRENHVYKEVMEAIRSPVKHSQNNRELFVSSNYSLACIRDTIELVSKGRLFIMAALSELHDTFMVAIAKKTLFSTPSDPKLNKKAPTLSQMQKKILFFIAWANEISQDLIPELEFGLRAVLAEYERYESKPLENVDAPESISMMAQEPKKTPKKPMIEELT